MFSSAATFLELCLFTKGDLESGRVTSRVRLDPQLNRTGDVWHIMLPQLDQSLLYGVKSSLASFKLITLFLACCRHSHKALPTKNSWMLAGFRLGGRHQDKDVALSAAGHRYEEVCWVE